MALSSQPNRFRECLAAEHRAWLSAFDAQHLRNWEKLLNNDHEAALTEAGVRRFLESRGVMVQPNEDLTGGRQTPDFRCERNNETFFVEVACISVEKATEITGLTDGPQAALRPSPLNDKVFSICKGKAKQCGGQDVPVLLAIGTFHGFACMFSFSPPYVDMLLVGMTKMTVTIDRQTMKSVGGIERESELWSAAFLRPDPEAGIGFARSSIAGLLLCGVSLEPMWVVGVLHPNPARRFEPLLLPGVSFGKVQVDQNTGQLRVTWPNGKGK